MKNVYLKKSLIEELKEKTNIRLVLFAVTENLVPSPILVGCLTGHIRYLNLNKDFFKISFQDQSRIIKEKINVHFNATQGKIFGYGRITHYILKKKYDQKPEALQIFDLNGDLIISISGNPREI